VSDSYLQFIPQAMHFIPDRLAQEKARELFSRLVPKAEDVSMWMNETKMSFVDQGTNFDNLHCPICKQELDTEWWGQAMDKAFEGDGFTNLTIQTPCRHSLSSLNDLEYYFPAGFAQFGLSARNPNVTTEQTLRIQAELEKVLGCELKLIWSHY
jgi:hypothetical protein